MRAVAPEHNGFSTVLLQHEVAELGIHLSQLADQTVANELRCVEMAVAQRRRLEVGNRITDRSHNPVGKPDPRAGLEAAGKRLRDQAFAPATETAMSVRCAEIDLFA